MGVRGEIAGNTFIPAKKESVKLHLEDCPRQNQTNKQQPGGSPLWFDVYRQLACPCLFMLSFIFRLVFSGIQAHYEGEKKAQSIKDFIYNKHLS